MHKIAFSVAVVPWVFPGILSSVQNIAPDAVNADFVKNYNTAGVLPDIICVFVVSVPVVYFIVKALMGV